MPTQSAGHPRARLALLPVLALLAALLLTRLLAQAAQAERLTQLPAARLPGPSAAGPAGITPSPAVTLYLAAILQPNATPPPAACPATITGWKGEYWNNATLSGNPTLCRDDASLAFDWGQGSPTPAIPSDHFSARWTRRLSLAAGHYRFHLAGDDGLRLWIDGSQVIDAWKMQSRTEYVAELDLVAGNHDVKVEYYEDQGDASVALWWDTSTGTCANFQAEYYNNASLSGSPAFTRCENWFINHDWGTAGPGGGLGSENFSARWTGRAHITAGTYNFVARADDGVRVWLGSQLLVDAWRDQSPTEFLVTRTLAEGDYDIKVEYYQRTGGAVAQFWWQRRDTPPGIVISEKQGFDICRLPTTAELLTWWNKSPYWEANIYIGGTLRFCDQPNLTPQALSAAHTQGWNFIPTWVGPQAPCSDYQARMAADPAAARDQGRAEAQAAAGAAQALGLPALGGAGGSSIIYYDLEWYQGDSACRNTVKSFMDGWASRLHELGLRAGAYASPCGGYIADWATNGTPPDDVWPAAWITDSYNANATVWGLTCLSDTIWANHQRVRQYAGGHDETWGGLTFNIDSNVLNGHVAGDNDRPITPTLVAATTAPNVAAAADHSLAAAQLLPEGQGWALAGGRLLWSADGGQGWTDITPAMAGAPRAAYFVDPAHGWLLLAASGDGSAAGLVVARTADGGKSWSAQALAGLNADPASILHSPAYLDFVDAQNGWLALKLPSSSNFSLGALFATHDGGQSWERLSLPIGAAVRFSDRSTGWVAGGARGDELYVTHDGGRSWQPQELPALPEAGPAAYGLPTFRGPRDGVLPVTLAGASPRLAIYRTHDGGASWQADGGVTLAGPVAPGTTAPGAPLPAGLLPDLNWVVADPASGRLWSGGASSAQARQLAVGAQLEGAAELQFAATGVGWVQVQSGTCTGDKVAAAPAGAPAQPFACTARHALLRTTDGGASWSEVTP